LSNTTIGRSGQETTPRVDRGRELYAEHADEIRFDEGVWLIPSQHDVVSVYEVVLGRQGESRECSDFDHHGLEEVCKHIVAATLARAKTAPCDGCGQRFRHGELLEVHPEHGSLNRFVGDRLCRECALDAGVLAAPSGRLLDSVGRIMTTMTLLLVTATVFAVVVLLGVLIVNGVYVLLDRRSRRRRRHRLRGPVD
jgi:hypothetical protein